MAKYSAEIKVPVAVNGLIKSGNCGRATVRAKRQSPRSLLVESDDMASFRAAVNSVLRDLLVIGSASSAVDHAKG